MLSINAVTSEYGIPSLKITMSGRTTIEIDLMDFYRNQEFLPYMYVHVNGYIMTLPLAVQEELYNTIFDVHQFNQTNNYSSNESTKYLEGKVDAMAKLLNMDLWRTWFRENSKGLFIPETVQDVFVFDPDMGITKDKTYTREEYIDLTGFILFIRALSPLYIDYLTYTKQSSKHPYYMLFRLFICSCLDREDNELGKLRNYIDANYLTLIGSGKNEHLVLTAGLSDDDIIDYLIAEVIFIKLLTIDFFNVKCNAVAYVFQTIRYKGNFRTNESSKLRATSSKGTPGREDYSYFEDYRKTTSIPVGTVVELQNALNDPVILARNLGYTNFDFTLYNRELKNVNKLTEYPVENVQIYLLGWFLERVINPRALFHIERRKIAELLIFAKVAMLKGNQSFIGIFLTSVRGDDSQIVNVVLRNTLNRKLLDDLQPQFKFVMEGDRGSVIEKTISEASRAISNSVWVPIGSMGNTKGLLTSDGFLEVPANINDIVTSFVAYVLCNKKASVVEV